MAHPIITLLPWVPPLVPHIIPPRYITLGIADVALKEKNEMRARKNTVNR